MNNETKNIASLPFSDELKDKLYSYIGNTNNSDGDQCGCALIGCPNTIAPMILSAIAGDLGCTLHVMDFKSNSFEKEPELVTWLTNLGESDVIALFNVQNIKSILFPVLRDAIVKHIINITIGKGTTARSISLVLPLYRIIIVSEEKCFIPFDLLEGLFSTIDLTVHKKELRQELVHSTFKKYGLSISSQAAAQLSELTCCDQELFSRIYEIRNRAFEAEAIEITEQLIAGVQADIPEIETVDNMVGREFELFAGNLFRNLEFSNIIVTPSSGDFGADVIGEKDDVRYAIQCKRYSTPVGVAAVQEVMASKSLHDCHVACVLTNNTFTPAAVELAKKNLVILWVRTKLKEFIDRVNIKTNAANNSLLPKECKPG